LHIDLPRLRLGKDGDGIAARDLTQGEDAFEAFNPFAFDSIAQQSFSPSLSVCDYTLVDVSQDNLTAVLSKGAFTLRGPS
jgi:hypothetical protein